MYSTFYASQRRTCESIALSGGSVKPSLTGQMQRAMREGPANVALMTMPIIARDEMDPARAVDIRKILYSWVTLHKNPAFLSYSGPNASKVRRTGVGKAQNTVFQCLCNVKDAILFLSYIGPHKLL